MFSPAAAPASTVSRVAPTLPPKLPPAACWLRNHCSPTCAANCSRVMAGGVDSKGPQCHPSTSPGLTTESAAPTWEATHWPSCSRNNPQYWFGSQKQLSSEQPTASIAQTAAPKSKSAMPAAMPLSRSACRLEIVGDTNVTRRTSMRPSPKSTRTSAWLMSSWAASIGPLETLGFSLSLRVRVRASATENAACNASIRLNATPNTNSAVRSARRRCDPKLGCVLYLRGRSSEPASAGLRLCQTPVSTGSVGRGSGSSKTNRPTRAVGREVSVVEAGG